MPHNPQVKIVVEPKLADMLASRREARNAERTAAGQPPVQDESPFISSAELETENAPDTPRKAYRARITAAAKAKIDARCKSIPGFERHSRKCQVCHNRDVEEIEDWYINWSSAHWIALTFKVGLEDVVYRHARATGLDVLRRRNARMVVEKIMEQVDQVDVTSSTILRATRALSCMDDQGRWTDPPSTHIVLTSKGLPEQITTSTAGRAALVPNEDNTPIVDEMAESNRGNMKN
jgi:hypothetical protein